MPTVSEIIRLLGGRDRAAAEPIVLEVPGYMPLVIEAAGVGPRGGQLVSVMHYYEQHGDVMRDPEVVFEVAGDDWAPVSFQQDGLGVYQEAVAVEADGRVRVRPDLQAGLRSFARAWDRNLRDQGFLDAARAQARRRDRRA
jgi:hypothetical protein